MEEAGFAFEVALNNLQPVFDMIKPSFKPLYQVPFNIADTLTQTLAVSIQGVLEVVQWFFLSGLS